MREKLFYLVDEDNEGSKAGKVYNIIMLIMIIASVVPMTTIQEYPYWSIVNLICGIAFVFDYIVRFFTADFKLKKGKVSFLQYPFTPMAVIDLLSLLPFLSFVTGQWQLMKMFRVLRFFRMLRVFKVIRYSKSIQLFLNVFYKKKEALLTIFSVAVVYVLVMALAAYNVEPETFGSYFKAIYWAVISLTTMGYGDIYPVTTGGQIVTIISAIAGVAVVAMPAGVITAGFIEEVNLQTEESQKIKQEQQTEESRKIKQEQQTEESQ